MIHDSDIAFHTPSEVSFDWAETGFFNFYVPEANLMGWVYIVHRAGVGATVADFEIVDRWSRGLHEAIYMDMTHHNPLPTRAEAFSLPNGLSFEARSLRDYRLEYKAAGVELNLHCTSLMEPYDIHDPAMDPMATSDTAAAIRNSGFGAGYAAHFDMTIRVQGTISYADVVHSINCVSTMDHSWGPRPESGMHPILWLNAHFGEGYALHGIFAYDRYAPIGEQHQFKHGYAMIDGNVRGATSGAVCTTREGLFPLAAEFSLVDVDGREHRVSGKALTHHPWMPYGNNFAPVAMMRWELDSDIGHGTYMEGLPLNVVRP